MFLGALIPLAHAAVHPAWPPISSEELALKQSKSDPNADAEALCREVWIDRHSITNYVRLKIFNERGREKYSNVKIEYWGSFRISDITARTIEPDGKIVDLSKDAVFDTVKVKSKRGDLNVKALSFAMPAVEPGAIIEYGWTENERFTASDYIPLELQSEFPVDEIRFYLKPPSGESQNLHLLSFGCQYDQSAFPYLGYTTITVHNVPAYHDEPFSPPRLVNQQWLLPYYTSYPEYSTYNYWNFIGKFEYEEAKKKIKLNGDMKQIAAMIVANGKTDEEKLALLADYCRRNIKNIHSASSTTEERDQFKPNRNSVDTLRRQIGTPRDIDLEFIALAQAAGYNARLAIVADRRDFFFNPRIRCAAFLNNFDAAVELQGKWQFYDVSDEWAPAGTLGWKEQGVPALIPDPTDSDWVTTPFLSAGESKIERIAELTLSSEGDLEGDIRELYSGNESFDFRREHTSQTVAEREEFVKEKIKEIAPDFQATNIRVTISPDAKLPVGIGYHLLAKNYAQRTQGRLFLKPGFLHSAASAYFPSSERNNSIYFPYPWSEYDLVTIRLPADFQLDRAESPESVKFAPTGEYSAKLFMSRTSNTLTYRRELTVGSDEELLFPVDRYATVKSVFDRIHAADEYLVALKAGY